MSTSILSSVLDLIKPKLIKISTAFFRNLPNESDEIFFLYLKSFVFTDVFDGRIDKAAKIAASTPFESYKTILSTFPLLSPEDIKSSPELFQQSIACNIPESQFVNPYLKHGLSFIFYNLYSHFVFKLSQNVDFLDNKKIMNDNNGQFSNDISSLCELIAEFCLQDFSTNFEYKIQLLLMSKWSNAVSNLSLHCNDNSIYEKMKTFLNCNTNRNIVFIFFAKVEYHELPKEIDDKLLSIFNETLLKPDLSENELENFSGFLYNLFGQWFLISPDLSQSNFIQLLFRSISNYITIDKGKNMSLHLLVLLATFSDNQSLMIDPIQLIAKYLFNLSNVIVVSPLSILSALKVLLRGRNYAIAFRKKKEQLNFTQWKYETISIENIDIIFQYVKKNLIKYCDKQHKLAHFFTQIAAISLDFWLEKGIPELIRPEIMAFCKDALVETFEVLFDIIPTKNVKYYEKITQAATEYLILNLKEMKIEYNCLKSVYNIYPNINMKEYISTNEENIEQFREFLEIKKDSNFLFQIVPTNDFPLFMSDSNLKKLKIFDLTHFCFHSNELICVICDLLIHEQKSIAISAVKSLENIILERNDINYIIFDYLLETFEKHKANLVIHYICLSAVAYFLDLCKNNSIKLKNETAENFNKLIIYSLCSKSVEIRKLTFDIIDIVKNSFTRFLKEKNDEISSEATKNVYLFARSDIRINRIQKKKLKLNEVLKTRASSLIIFYLSCLGKFLSKNDLLAKQTISYFTNIIHGLTFKNDNILALLLPMITNVSQEIKEVLNIYFLNFDIKTASIFSCASPQLINYFLSMKKQLLQPPEFHVMMYLLRIRAKEIEIDTEPLSRQFQNYLINIGALKNDAPTFQVNSALIEDNKNGIFNFANFTYKKLRKMETPEILGYFGYEPIKKTLKNEQTNRNNIIFWLNLSSFNSQTENIQEKTSNNSSLCTITNIVEHNCQKPNSYNEKLPCKTFSSIFRKSLYYILLYNKIPKDIMTVIFEKLPILASTTPSISKIVFTHYFNDELIQKSRVSYYYFCGFINLFSHHYPRTEKVNKFDAFIFSNIGKIISLCIFYLKRANIFLEKVSIYRVIKALCEIFEPKNHFNYNPDDLSSIIYHISKVFKFCGEQVIKESLLLNMIDVANSFFKISRIQKLVSPKKLFFDFIQFGLVDETLPYYQEFTPFSLINNILYVNSFTFEITSMIDKFISISDQCLSFIVQLSFFIEKDSLRTIYAYLYSKDPKRLLQNFIPFLQVKTWYFMFLNRIDFSRVYPFIISIFRDFALEDTSSLIEYIPMIKTFCKLFDHNFNVNELLNIINQAENSQENNKDYMKERIPEVNYYLFSWGYMCGNIKIASRAIELINKNINKGIVSNNQIFSKEKVEIALRSLYITAQMLFEESNQIKAKDLVEDIITFDDDQFGLTGSFVANDNFSLSFISQTIEFISNSKLISQETFDFIIQFINYKKSENVIEKVLQFILKTIKYSNIKDNIDFTSLMEHVFTSQFNPTSNHIIFEIIVELVTISDKTVEKGTHDYSNYSFLLLALIPYLLSPSSTFEKTLTTYQCFFGKSNSVNDSLSTLMINEQNYNSSYINDLQNLYYALAPGINRNAAEILLELYSKLIRQQSDYHSSYYLAAFLLKSNLIQADSPIIGNMAREAINNSNISSTPGQQTSGSSCNINIFESTQRNSKIENNHNYSGFFDNVKFVETINYFLKTVVQYCHVKTMQVISNPMAKVVYPQIICERIEKEILEHHENVMKNETKIIIDSEDTNNTPFQMFVGYKFSETPIINLIRKENVLINVEPFTTWKKIISTQKDFTPENKEVSDLKFTISTLKKQKSKEAE